MGPGEERSGGADLDPRLVALRACAAALAQDAIARDIDASAARVAGGRFHVACVGQFKRGKSTLLNALVGRRVLPVGVLPVTSVITVLRHGEAAARIHFADAAPRDVAIDELAEFVSEERNPHNEKRVVAAEVFVPAELLRSGLCLVDTPGLGSVFAHNSAATRAFVPQVDAALVCVGADPPISAEELELVAELASEGATLLVVLTKADRATRGELDEAAAFAARTITRRIGRPPGRIFGVSAAEQLEGNGAERDWPALVAALGELSGADLVAAAGTRLVRLFAARLRHETAERRAALARPLAESERRIAALREASARATESLHDLRPLLDVAERRLQAELRAERDAALARIAPPAGTRLAPQLKQSASARRGERLASAHAAARDVARSALEAWRPEAEAEARRLYGDAVRRFVEGARASLAEVVELTGGDPDAAGELLLERAQRWRAPSRLFFTDVLPHTTRTPLGWLVDAALPRGRFVRRVARRAAVYLELLLFTNANRLVNDVIAQVQQSRAELERDVAQLLRDLCDTAQRALVLAEEARAGGEPAVRTELALLDEIERRVAAAETGGASSERARAASRPG